MNTSERRQRQHRQQKRKRLSRFSKSSLQRALQESRRRFQAVWDAVPDAMVLSDRDGIVLAANPAYYCLYGYTPEEVLGKDFALISPEAQRPRTRQRYREAFDDPIIRSPVEASIVRADGSERIVESSYSLITHNSTRIAMLSLVRDITDRKQVEELNRFKLISDLANDGNTIFDRQGRVVYINRAQYEMFGYTAEEFRRMTVQELYPNATASTYQDFFVRAQREKIPPFETILRRKDGSTLSVEVGLTGISFDGEPHLMGIVRDITERKQVEQQQARRAREAALRADVSQALTGAGSLQRMLQDCCQALQYHLQPFFIRIWTLSSEKDVLLLQASAGNYTHLDGPYSRIPVGASYIRRIVQEGQPHLSNDLLNDPLIGDKEWAIQEHLVAFAVYPLLLEQQVIGVVAMFAREQITEEVLEVFSLVADSIAQGVGRKWAEERLEERVEQRTRELSLLLQVSQSVASTLEFEPLLQTILAQLKAVIDYSEVALLSLQDEQFVVLASLGAQSPEEMERGLRLLGQSSLYTRIRHQRETIIVDDFHAHQQFAQGYQHVAHEHAEEQMAQIRSWMGVPLIAGERVIGMLSLSHSRPHFYTSRHANLAFALANQAAIALENAHLYEEAQKLAVWHERQRLSRDLHDSVSQLLYGISLNTQIAHESLDQMDTAQALASIDKIGQNIEAAIGEMRALLYELRPDFLETDGLVVALVKHVEFLFVTRGKKVNVSLSEEPEVPIQVKQTLYRLAQEALHNVVKHARASTVTLRLTDEHEALVLEVSDNGRGFDTSHHLYGHLGLRTMQERVAEINGTLSIKSSPGQGTTIVARVPF